MHQSICLNCDTVLTGKFCANCGQKSATHRITAKHFILHDLVHGVWHVDKGLLFTLKQTFTRPGYAAMDYINGKRVRYYNIFYLMILVLGLILIADHYNGEQLWQKKADEQNKAADLVGKYLKVFFVSLIPIFSINALVLFRKLKLNFFEHHIIAGFTLLGMYICLLFGIVSGSYESGSDITVGYVINLFIGFIFAAFPAYVYFQCTREKFSVLWVFMEDYTILYFSSRTNKVFNKRTQFSIKSYIAFVLIQAYMLTFTSQ